jgi:hypothetical protein
MRNKITLLFMLICGNIFAQSVPNTTTFTLQNVYDVVHGHTAATTGDLQSCFDNSVAAYFDATYGSKTMSPKTLYGFRNYTVTCPNVGDAVLGGVVAYKFVSGDYGYVSGECHGLIIAKGDEGPINWGCSGTTLGASYVAIGYGQANTNIMLTQCPFYAYPAKICDQYSITDGGVVYDDWFLPTINELGIINVLKMKNSGVTLVTTAGSGYWSSTEYSSTSADIITYDSGIPRYSTLPKNGQWPVKPFRYF